MFSKLRFFLASLFTSLVRFGVFSTDAIIEAITAIVTVTLIDVYVIGSDAIINSDTAIGGVVKPIIQAVLLIVGILIAIGLLRAGAKAK